MIFWWYFGQGIFIGSHLIHGLAPNLSWSNGPSLAPEVSHLRIHVRLGHVWNLHINLDNKIDYYRRKFRSYTSDNMDSWKAEVRRVRREKSKKTEDTDARKGRKVAKHCVFPMICGSGGSKSRLAKAAGAEPAGHRSDEKLHAVVARSTFWSQNVQNTPFSDHFWKFRCRKSARRCGAKHILKSKCTKHLSVGPLLEVAMSKKCTPLWREAHFQVKMYKTHHARTTFGGSDVEKASKKCTPLWREAHFEVKSVKNWGFWAFFEVQMSKK